MTSKLCRGVLIALALTFCLGSGLSAQTIQGRLLERGSDRPIELGLLIMFSATGDSVMSTLSDAQGAFRVSSAEPGDFLLLGSALGYEETTVGLFELGQGGELSVEFRLSPAPIRLGGLVVESSSSLISEPSLVANGFVRRAQRGSGYFITPGEIRKGGVFSTQQLLGRVPRVVVDAESAGPFASAVRMLGNRGYCTPRTYVDGILVPLAPGMGMDVIAPINDLEAVEVYRTATEAPIEYAGVTGDGCGVILFWTHRR